MKKQAAFYFSCRPSPYVGFQVGGNLFEIIRQSRPSCQEKQSGKTVKREKIRPLLIFLEKNQTGVLFDFSLFAL